MLIIGEKINGAIPAVGEAIKNRDASVIAQRAILQANAGADFIDCAPSTTPDQEYDAMCWMIDVIQSATDRPICIDSPNARLLARILEEGRVVRPGAVNSVNEEGDKCETIFPLIAGTDWHVIGLTCDKEGIPSDPAKKLEIAKVISKHAKVVVLDEPTSSLSEKEIDSLFEQVRKMKAAKTTMIYVTHRMAELSIICERCSIFRDGLKVAEYMIKDVDEQTIVNSMVGRELGAFVKPEHTAKEEVLRVENLCQKGKFENVSFHANAGEIVAFSGLVGAGRTEVMEAIFGATKLTSGKVFLNGEEVHIKSPWDAISRGIGLATEDRRRTGLMLQATLRHNIVLPSLPYHHRRFGFLDNKWETDIAQEMTQKLRVKTPSIQTIIANLSGGNQQKVILAKWLIANSKILILDEPTRGIDVNAKSEFYALMNDFVADGGCIIMVSSELPEMLGVADRIIVMREGVQGGEISGADATEQSVIQLASVQSNV